MIPLDSLSALELAKKHIEGHDRPEDEDYPNCWLCGEFMESGEPTAFCDRCVYLAADKMAEDLVKLSDEFKIQRAAAEVIADSRTRYKTRVDELEQLARDYFGAMDAWMKAKTDFDRHDLNPAWRSAAQKLREVVGAKSSPEYCDADVEGTHGRFRDCNNPLPCKDHPK